MDCDDVLQDVLAALMNAMPGFEYDPARGKFRSYLKTVTLHAIYKKTRQKPGGKQLPQNIEEATRLAAEDEEIEQAWEQEWREHHLRQALKTISVEFNEADRLAFERYAVEGESAQTTAETLGLSVDQVYQAKSRIARRLSELIAQQVADEG